MTETKTNKDTTPKADPAAASQHPFSGSFASFDPMAAWTAAQANFHKMMADAFGRAQSWADEYASMEAQMFARANQAVDTWAQLAHDSLTYTANLTAQARKIGFEAVRKTGIGA